MRKSLLLVVILMMTVAFTGCQQTGLTEEEIRSIIQEELGLAPEVIEEGDTDPPTTPEVIEEEEAGLGVTISDYALEVALRNALNKPEGQIYKSDLQSLTSLDLADNNISDISVLSGLSNLEWLDLSGNNIIYISPLFGLTKLETLDLTTNNISDISALSGLSNLEWLSLHGNNISDISTLVINLGISSGDTVYLTNNPLASEAINIHIPQLKARDVSVIR